MPRSEEIPATGKRMTNWVGPIGVCLLLGGSAGATAQQQTFACDKICWTPANHSATCSSKLSQADLTAYIYAVRHNDIAKGKGITFHLDLKSKGQTCASPETQGRSISVVGYVNVESVTAFTVGTLKAGDLIEITGGGIEQGQENTFFFPAP
jgi:hypothetical protein